MRIQLKPLDQQVIVITGATSGIGLATARLAAREGARVVIAARSERDLRTLASELEVSGTRAVAIPADVSNEDDVRRIAGTAVREFSGFDTWVNNAGVIIYGRVEGVPTDDGRRLFEVNFWGVVYGSLTAVRHFKERRTADGHAGALINVGSVESDRAAPLHAMYAASKHAVKGFTDALRMELESDGTPVSVTLVKPGSIDTPLPEHAKTFLEREPTLPPPVYAPDVVARAILHAAVQPQRDVFVGASAKVLSSAGRWAPRTTDRVMERTMIRAQQKDAPAHVGDNLTTPGGGLRERGRYEGRVMRSSAYTVASLRPWRTALLLGMAGAAFAAAIGVARTASVPANV